MIDEIDDPAALAAHLDQGRPLAGVVLQGLDLRPWAAALCARDLAGVTLLGGVAPPELLAHAHRAGALVFPAIPDVPYPTFPRRLYGVEDLYGGFDPARPESYADTLDARVYRHWQASGGAQPGSILEALARRLHDHGITDAKHELLADAGGRKVVAIMGGHSLPRGRGGYHAVARIARALTRRGFLMVSGGGPGAMEATHLGAYLAPRPDAALDAATTHLAAAPGYRDREWLARAFEVRRRYPLEDPRGGASLGIPTWLYGHEPPNPFATHIAKYFANSEREAGLLSVATHGVVFSPGSAGTIQEIFQDACQNHYVTAGVVSPMVFLDRAYWTEHKPVYPLLEHLAAGREYARWLRITDDPDEVIGALVAYDEASRS